MEEKNLIESYLDFFAGTEPPTIFNRWACIAGIAGLLGRQCWVQHGHVKIYPNQFIMLVGESGTRKSTAIKDFLRPLLVDAGYKKFAAKKTSKEKFLVDLHDGMEHIYEVDEERLNVNKRTKGQYHNPTMKELFGLNHSGPSECLIAADEFNIFLGHKNIEFIELLTDLWDFNGQYPGRTQSGKAILINDPTLNIIGGNTQVGISMAFPQEVIGQGFFARLISVFSEPSGRRITWPAPPDPIKRKVILDGFNRIKTSFHGPVSLDPMAIIALDDIYQNWKDLDDTRFKSYSQRRFTHLLKLSLCCAAACEYKTINTRIIEYANTILHYTESFMPKALGEFGKARHSDISAKILGILEKAESPMNPMDEIWPLVHRDLESSQEFVRVLEGLKSAGKIQQIAGRLLPNKKPITFDYPHCKVTLLREYIEEKKAKGEPI